MENILLIAHRLTLPHAVQDMCIGLCQRPDVSIGAYRGMLIKLFFQKIQHPQPEHMFILQAQIYSPTGFMQTLKKQMIRKYAAAWLTENVPVYQVI